MADTYFDGLQCNQGGLPVHGSTITSLTATNKRYTGVVKGIAATSGMKVSIIKG